MKLIPIYSVQVYIVDITSDNYTTVIMKELERNIKIYSEAVNKMKKHIDNINSNN